MTGLRSLVTATDPATWVGRVLGVLLFAFFVWVLWQVLPMLIGDALQLVECWTC